MKVNIQPEYNLAKVNCSTCGEEFEVGSTLKEIKVDTCSKCHPFYTGKQSRASHAGTVDKFNRKYGFSNQEENKAE